MKRTIYILLLVLLGVSQAFAARVNNVELSYRDGNTVAKIFVEGKVRFVHQTEEAKDGKPYRVIVDVLSATHNLGQKNFYQLPGCLIKSIRSSQYSISPEQIVRVVFDLKETSIYRVDSDNESVSVFFQDKKIPAFSTWSTSKFLAPKTNKPVDDKKVSTPPTVAKTETKVSAVPVVRASTKKVTKPVQAVAVKEPVKLVNEEEAAKVEAKKPVVAKADPSASKEKPKAVTKNKPAAKPAAKGVKAEKKKSPVLASNESAKDKSANQYSVVPKTRPSKLSQKNSATQKNSSQKPKKTTKAPPAKTKTGVKPTSDKNKAESKSVDKPKVKEQKSKSSTTSRFRRSPTSPTKIKGTLVAEFPKRLVIKYKARSYRDPFETLINDNRSYQGPVEQRMPNVEGLKLVGIIESTGGSNRALFEDKESYSYILKSGDKVKKGYVLRVESDRVYFQIFEYGWSRTIALKIEEY